jgi:subtilisin family serine protease
LFCVFICFSDPLYSAQEWVYDLINIVPVWEKGYFGNGIRVRINDDGMDTGHAEFAGRYDRNASCEIDGPTETTDAAHGTTVAAIIAAGSNNNECSVGIAPQATLSSCNIFATINATGILSGFAEKLDSFDISQNSFGLIRCKESKSSERRRLQECPFQAGDDRPSRVDPCDICDFGAATISTDCESAIVSHCGSFFEEDASGCLEFLHLFINGTCDYHQLSDQVLQELVTGINEGRGGKGAIYVFASGNSFKIGDDVNFGGLTNSRLTITVGAVGKDGFHSSYSSPGAALFVSAPGGDFESVANHVTANVGGGCHNAGSGTSFAAPVVSGVIALMLEANSDLSWRDVQHILALTSGMVFDDPYDDSRITNAAGFHHSNLYGFGVIDASDAVTTAKTWELVGSERILAGESGSVDLIIGDKPVSPVTSIVTLSTASNFLAESVVVLLDLQHFSRGDLEVTLVSPRGTTSVLHPGKTPENSQLGEDERWKLMTVRNWGESAVGEWKLAIRDLRIGDVTDCVDSPFSIDFLGQRVTCEFMSDVAVHCIDGALNNETLGDSFDDLLQLTDNGFTVEEACCACGGGFRTNDFDDVLRQWRIVVYGREVGFVPELSTIPSDYPSNLPSTKPSSIPSDTPSFVPSISPTITPSAQPQAPSFEKTSNASTKSDTDQAETIQTETITTIVASIGALLLVMLCVWGILRNPSSPADRFKVGTEFGTGENGQMA